MAHNPVFGVANLVRVGVFPLGADLNNQRWNDCRVMLPHAPNGNARQDFLPRLKNTMIDFSIFSFAVVFVLGDLLVFGTPQNGNKGVLNAFLVGIIHVTK